MAEAEAEAEANLEVYESDLQRGKFAVTMNIDIENLMVDGSLFPKATLEVVVDGKEYFLLNNVNAKTALVIGGGIPNSTILGVYRLEEGRKWYCTLNDNHEGDLERYHGKVIRLSQPEVSLTLRDVKKKSVKATMHWVPPHLSKEEIERVFSPLAKKGTLKIEKPTRGELDKRWVTYEPLSDSTKFLPPHYLRLSTTSGKIFKVLITVPGRRKACGRCFTEGHLERFCPERRDRVQTLEEEKEDNGDGVGEDDMGDDTSTKRSTSVHDPGSFTSGEFRQGVRMVPFSDAVKGRKGDGAGNLPRDINPLIRHLAEQVDSSTPGSQNGSVGNGPSSQVKKKKKKVKTDKRQVKTDSQKNPGALEDNSKKKDEDSLMNMALGVESQTDKVGSDKEDKVSSEEDDKVESDEKDKVESDEEDKVESDEEDKVESDEEGNVSSDEEERNNSAQDLVINLDTPDATAGEGNTRKHQREKRFRSDEGLENDEKRIRKEQEEANSEGEGKEKGEEDEEENLEKNKQSGTEMEDGEIFDDEDGDNGNPLLSDSYIAPSGKPKPTSPPFFTSTQIPREKQSNFRSTSSEVD